MVLPCSLHLLLFYGLKPCIRLSAARRCVPPPSNRSEAVDAVGKTMGPRQYNRLFLTLAPGERAGGRFPAASWERDVCARRAPCPQPPSPCFDRSAARASHPRRRPSAARADAHRWRVGLPPFPRAVPPPPPPTEDRKAEILADPR
jgi:hypothetical protein